MESIEKDSVVCKEFFAENCVNKLYLFQSIIITVADGEEFVDAVMKSILDQELGDLIELECVVFFDDCKDKTPEKVGSYKEAFTRNNISLITINNDLQRKGVGYGRNRAIEASYGDYLCFLDIDDVMYPKRITSQLRAAKRNQNAVIFGLKFTNKIDYCHSELFLIFSLLALSSFALTIPQRDLLSGPIFCRRIN